MNNNEKKEFQYTYSAKEQAELKKIRDKYAVETMSEEIDKMVRIRKLDASVTKPATIISVCVGALGSLIMGSGMSLIMTDEIKAWLGMSGDAALTVGIIVGFLGMLAVFAAYPLYQYIIKKRRKKIAPEILKLTEELMNESQK